MISNTSGQWNAGPTMRNSRGTSELHSCLVFVRIPLLFPQTNCNIWPAPRAQRPTWSALLGLFKVEWILIRNITKRIPFHFTIKKSLQTNHSWVFKKKHHTPWIYPRGKIWGITRNLRQSYYRTERSSPDLSRVVSKYWLMRTHSPHRQARTARGRGVGCVVHVLC